MTSSTVLRLCSCYGSIRAFEDSERRRFWVRFDKVVFRETDDWLNKVAATENDMPAWRESDNPQPIAPAYTCDASTRQDRRSDCVSRDKRLGGDAGLLDRDFGRVYGGDCRESSCSR